MPGCLAPVFLSLEIPMIIALTKSSCDTSFYPSLFAAMSDMHLVDGPGATIDADVYKVVRKVAPLMMVLHMVVQEKPVFLPKAVAKLVHGIDDWSIDKVSSILITFT